MTAPGEMVPTMAGLDFAAEKLSEIISMLRDHPEDPRSARFALRCARAALHAIAPGGIQPYLGSDE